MPERNWSYDPEVRDSFVLDRVDIKRFNKRNIMVILAHSQLISNEVYVFLRGNYLVIETPRIIQPEHPFRTHLIAEDVRSEFERGMMDILFSEIKMNRKYSYHIISYGLVRTGMLKVVLKFSKV